MVHVCDMFTSELQSFGDWFSGSGEAAIKAQAALITSFADERINQQQVRLGCRNNPPSICSDVDTNDRVAKWGQSRLRILADRVEEPYITLLTCNGKLTARSRSNTREFVLPSVLLVLVVNQLRTRHTRINAEERIVRCTNESLLARGLREFVVRGDVINTNIIVNFPLFDHFTAFDVHTVERVGFVGVHQDHLCVLIMQHDLTKDVSSCTWSLRISVIPPSA